MLPPPPPHAPAPAWHQATTAAATPTATPSLPTLPRALSLDAMPVGALVNILRVAAAAGLPPYTPLHPLALPAARLPPPEPARIQARATELLRALAGRLPLTAVQAAPSSAGRPSRSRSRSFDRDRDRDRREHGRDRGRDTYGYTRRSSRSRSRSRSRGGEWGGSAARGDDRSRAALPL